MFPHNFDFEVTEEEEDVSAIDFEDDDPASALRFERGPWPASNSMDESITCAIREFIDKGGASFPVALETAMDMAQQNQLMFLLRFNACEIPRNVQVRERLVDEEDQFSFIAHPQAQSILDGTIATKSMLHWRQKLIGVENIGPESVMVCTKFLSSLHAWMGVSGAIMNREAHVSRGGYSDKYTLEASATVANFMIFNDGDVSFFLSPTILLRSAGVDSTGAYELPHLETTSRGTRLAKLCHLVLAYRVAKSLKCLPTGHSDAGLLRLKGGIGLLKQAHRQQSVRPEARAKRYAEIKPWAELWAAQNGRVDIAFTNVLESVVIHGEGSGHTRHAAWCYQLELATTLTTQNAAARPSDLSSLQLMDIKAIRNVSNDKLVSVTISQWAGKGAKNKFLSGATAMSADVAIGVRAPGTYNITDEKSVNHFAFWVGTGKLRMPHIRGWPEFLDHGDAADAWVQRLTFGGLRLLLADDAVEDPGNVFLSFNGRQPLSRSSLSDQIKERVGLSPRFIRRSQSSSVAEGVLEDGVQTGARFALQAALNHGNQASLDHYGMAINTSEGLVMLAVLTRSLFCYTVILQNQQHQNETAFNAFRKGVQNQADGLGRASIHFSEPGSSSAGHAYASASADASDNPYESRELQPEFCDPSASARSTGPLDASSTDHVYGSGFTKRARNQLRVHVQARHCDSCGSVFSDPKALSKHKAFSTRICTSRRELAGSGLAAQIEAGRVAALAERVEAAKQRSLPRAVQLTATWNSNGSVNL